VEKWANSEDQSKAQKSKKTNSGIFLLTFCKETGKMQRLAKIKKNAKVLVLAIDIYRESR